MRLRHLINSGRIISHEAKFPERFRIMESEPERSKGMRRMLVDNYSVFYVIEEDKVIVTDVLYSGSDLESRLKGQNKK